MINKIFLLFSLFFTTALLAQENKKPQDEKRDQIKRVSFFQAGTLHGEKGMEMQLQLINGIQLNTWQLGVGGGLDYYFVRSVPVYIDVRKTLHSLGFPLYAYAEGGTNIPWIKQMPSFRQQNNYGKGIYYDAGVGYQFRSRKRSGFLLSAGYSQKQLTETNQGVNPCLIGPCPLYKNEYEYTLKRWSFKAGYRF